MSPTRYHCATPLQILLPWRPHEDSNLELLITKQVFCRLNYGALSRTLVGRQGLEPCLALYKNAVLTHTPTPVNLWSGIIESNDAYTLIRRAVTTSHPMPE